MTADSAPLLADRNPEAVDVAVEALRLLRALEEVGAIEWKRAPRPRLWESERQANPGGIPNPTFDVIADEYRLAVRVAVWDAWRRVHEAANVLNSALSYYEAAGSASVRPHRVKDVGGATTGITGES